MAWFIIEIFLYILSVLLAVRGPRARAGHIPAAIVLASPTSLFSPLAHCVTDFEADFFITIFGV
jgi:hypothetical protein